MNVISYGFKKRQTSISYERKFCIYRKEFEFFYVKFEEPLKNLSNLKQKIS
jgi:hypothetical protein